SHPCAPSIVGRGPARPRMKTQIPLEPELVFERLPAQGSSRLTSSHSFSRYSAKVSSLASQKASYLRIQSAASRNGSGSSRQVRTLPSLLVRTSPAFSSTERCLVASGKLIGPKLDSSDRDFGPLDTSRIKARRVGSERARNTPSRSDDKYFTMWLSI